jgi:hypothetical protein
MLFVAPLIEMPTRSQPLPVTIDWRCIGFSMLSRSKIALSNFEHHEIAKNFNIHH